MAEQMTTINLWACCYCQHGGMNASNTPHCVSCGVARCVHCPMEAHKVRDASRSHQEAETKETTSRPAAEKATEGETGIGSERPTIADSLAQQVAKSHDQQQELPPPRNPLRDSYYQGQTASTVLSGMSDDQTVVSSTSSASTLVHQGVAEAFARRIMTFQNLGCLWSQLVGRCNTKKRCIYIIKGLLQRYATDFEQMGYASQASPMPDSELYLTAACFIFNSRLQVANKIWESQANDLNNRGGKEAMENSSSIGHPDLDGGEGYDNLMFEKVEEILFDKGPIFSLQANIKLLINLSNPMNNSIVYWLSSRLNTAIGNAISSLHERPLSPGCNRLRYTCVSLTNLTFSLSSMFLASSGTPLLS